MPTDVNDSKYSAYQLKWMIDHGYSVDDLLNAIKSIFVEEAINGTLDSDMNIAFDDCVHTFLETGFGSSIWACKDEWLHSEAVTEYDVSYINYRDLVLVPNMMKHAKDIYIKRFGNEPDTDTLRSIATKVVDNTIADYEYNEAVSGAENYYLDLELDEIENNLQEVE